MVNGHIVNYHPSLSKLTSRIHALLVLWTARGLSLQDISRIFLVAGYSYPLARLSPRFLSLPPGRSKLHVPPEQRFLKIYFTRAERGREDYGAENMIKIKPARVLVTSFDKFHDLCNP